jgi:hypothetical protein
MSHGVCWYQIYKNPLLVFQSMSAMSEMSEMSAMSAMLYCFVDPINMTTSEKSHLLGIPPTLQAKSLRLSTTTKCKSLVLLSHDPCSAYCIILKQQSKMYSNLVKDGVYHDSYHWNPTNLYRNCYLGHEKRV